MFDVFLLIFVAETKIMFRYDFVAPLTIHVIIQKTMSPRKSDEDVLIKFCKF